MRRIGLATAGGALALAATMGMAACSRGNGQSASAGAGGDSAYAADRGGGGRGGYSSGGGGYGGEAREDRGPVPMFHGEPMWSENRSHSAKENAEYHFERAGGDLQAKTLDDFLTKVHRFGDHPPAGTLKMVRPNGDKLLYDPKANLFAVYTRDGAPRTVFKPNDGRAYWDEQKSRLAEGGGGYHRRSYGGGSYGRSDGGGGGGDAGQ